MLPEPVEDQQLTSVPHPPRETGLVHLNVCGVRHDVLWTTLAKLPHSRLGQLGSATGPEEISLLCDKYTSAEEEYFFDRNPQIFISLLNFYRTGKFHLTDETCLIDFNEELLYWGIDELQLAACCRQKYYEKKEDVEEQLRQEAEQEEEFGHSQFAKYRKYVWDIMEHPASSCSARIVTIISVSFIVLCSMAIALNTVPHLQECSQININPALCTELPNRNLFENRNYIPAVHNRTITQDELWVENHNFLLIQLVCMVWLTVEYALRLVSSPNRRKFFYGFLNTVDLLTILDFFGVWNFVLYSRNRWCYFQALRGIRILRVFKLTRNDTALDSLEYTLRKSYKYLGLVVVCLGIGVFIFSVLAYFAETEDNDDFMSIPTTLWWAVATMTTVGYGDMYPKTIGGKLIGMACCAAGILALALPIPILVYNFGEFYRKDKAIRRRDASMRDPTLRTPKKYKPVNSTIINEMNI